MSSQFERATIREYFSSRKCIFNLENACQIKSSVAYTEWQLFWKASPIYPNVHCSISIPVPYKGPSSLSWAAHSRRFSVLQHGDILVFMTTSEGLLEAFGIYILQVCAEHVVGLNVQFIHDPSQGLSSSIKAANSSKSTTDFMHTYKYCFRTSTPHNGMETFIVILGLALPESLQQVWVWHSFIHWYHCLCHFITDAIMYIFLVRSRALYY